MDYLQLHACELLGIGALVVGLAVGMSVGYSLGKEHVALKFVVRKQPRDAKGRFVAE